jgi:phage gpG-like protein
VAETFTSYSVDNDKRFRRALDEARNAVGDLRIPLTLISRDFFKSQKAIWLLSGPGQYPDLAPSTKRAKQKAGKPIYPILKDSGLLERSMTNPTDANAVNEIFGKSTLIVGTKVQYGVYHQSDAPRKHLPLRKFLFIGPEAARFATDEQKGRLQRWVSILQAHVIAQSRRIGEPG